MAKGVNKWIGIGNCCADPEIKYLPSGVAVTNITVACNDSYKDKTTGQLVDKTEFVRVVFYNRLAEVVGEYLKKGSKVYIEGSLSTRKWKNKEGVDQYATEIIANEMQMLGGAGSEPRQSAELKPKKEQQRAIDNYDDSDIPF